jgi:superfamily II DNA or RNA helicase
MNNQNKGLLYEKCVKDFIIQHFGINAFLWNECPENILIQNNLIHSHNEMRLIRKGIKEGHLHNHKDIGIDIIQFDNDNAKCSIVQCKNGYNNGLCIDDISGIMSRAAFVRDINTYIYYTSSLSRNLRYISKISPYVVYIDYTNEIDKLKLLEKDNNNKIYFVKLPYKDRNISESINEDIKSVITPYSYQSEAVNKFKEYYLSNNRGILAIPCGCGKTYISSLISIDYKQIVILSPLREFANQNLKRFIEYGYNKKDTLLVDSDGDRDIDSIKNFISKDKFVISCTYKSMDLIAECLDLFNDVLFIVDEFHNLSKSNILDETNNIYKLLISSHKILFMSATPRIYDFEYDYDYDNKECFGDVVYQMTFTEAIANKYITDYRIWLPSIHENDIELNKELSIYEIDNEIKNRCKFLYSCIANNGSKKCIIYCIDTEDMNSMMECMKTLNDFYIMDIDIHSISCDDSEKKRGYVLECFTNNEKIQLLFNIRILNECIDIQACDSVYISYAPKNKITTIQRISRSMRIDKKNPYKVANIYIWCEAYEEILETLSSIKEYDIMFKEKVKLSVVDFYNNKGEKELELIEKDKVLLRDCIIGVKEFKVISWEEKLVMVEDYIREYGKLPTSHNTDKYISSLASWVSTQRQNYKKNKEIMKNKNIRKLWDDFVKQYNHLFMSNRELWINNFKLLEEYINIHKELPSDYSKDPNTLKIARWKNTQKNNFKNTSHIMKEDENIKTIWEQFVNKNKKLFRNNEEKWLDNLREIEEYVQIHKQLPNHTNKDENTRYLAGWISVQKENYKLNKQIMINEEIRKIWEEFVNNYQEIFKSNEDIWKDNLNKLKEYINIHNILPTSCNEDENIKYLGLWVRNQTKNYDKKQYIMKNDEMITLWEEFMKENNKLFLNNEELWIENKHKVEEYIRHHNKLPAQTDKIQDIAVLGNWIQSQKQNYIKKSKIMVNENIRKLWEDFVKRYEKYFMSNEEIWMTRFDELNEYINIHKKLPTSRDTDMDMDSLVQWTRHQKRNYDNRNQIMNNETIRKIWKEFTDNNTALFITTDEIWFENKNKIEDYIQKYNKLPSQANKDKNISSLASWVSSQKQNYKNKEHIMKNNNDIVKEWEYFIEKHSILFRSNEEVWMDTLHKVCEYIEQYKKRPSASSKDKEISSLSKWLTFQRRNYENKEQIMGNEDIRKIWEDFVNKYQEVIMSNDELWIHNLNLLEKYVVDNDILPNIYSKISNEKRLGSYVHHQKHNYKNYKGNMKDSSIRKEWEQFTAKYPHLF